MCYIDDAERVYLVKTWEAGALTYKWLKINAQDLDDGFCDWELVDEIVAIETKTNLQRYDWVTRLYPDDEHQITHCPDVIVEGLAAINYTPDDLYHNRLRAEDLR